MTSSERIQYRLLWGVSRVAGWLPRGLLYRGFAPMVCWVLHRVVRYRVSVVRTNLANAFPEKSREELRDIERRFYRHLSEVFIDTILLGSISRREILERMVYRDVEKQEELMRGRILDSIESDKGQYDDPREVFWASGACMAVRADVFRSLGGFDGDFFAHMEEIDFCWRAQLAGYAVRVEPRSCVLHVGGGTLPNNSPQKIYLNFRNNLCMLFKNLSPLSFWPVLFARMALDGAAALVFLVQGRPDFFRQVFRAHIDFHRRRSSLHRKRRAIQRGRVARSRWIFFGSIVLRHALGRRRFGRMM